jgi:hypothetical protein
VKFLKILSYAFNRYQRDIKPRKKPRRKKKVGEARILRR